MLVSNDKYSRALFFVDFGEKLDDLVAHLGVDISSRLVGDNDSRIINERSCKTYTLLLAARELTGAVFQLMG